MGKLVFSMTQRDYGRFGLTGNPFPYAGIPDDNPGLCVDRERELRIIGQTVTTALNSRSTHVTIIGGYGNGKTHTLRFVKTEINRQLRNGGRRAVAGFVISPGQSLVDLYRAFMQDLGREFLTACAWEFVGRTAIDHHRLKDNPLHKLKLGARRRIKQEPAKIREYVEDGHVLLSSLLKPTRERALSAVKSVDVANAFLQLLAEETALLAWKWLSGEATLHEQRRQLGIVSPISTDDKVLGVFSDLRNILRITGYQLVCVLLDEFESIESLHVQQKQRFLNSIRHLIDLNPTGLCLVISCTPEVWKSMVREYHAFSERIFREMLLTPLSRETISGFIREYLEQFRLREKPRNGSIFPFNEAAIGFVLQFSQGNLRRALSLCNAAIDVALDENVEEIDPDLLKLAADRYVGL